MKPALSAEMIRAMKRIRVGPSGKSSNWYVTELKTNHFVTNQTLNALLKRGMIELANESTAPAFAKSMFSTIRLTDKGAQMLAELKS
jgi:hypothetical protein